MKIVALVVVVLALAACNAPPPSLTEADLAAIREVSDGFTEHMVAGDWAALMNLYTDDAVFMPPGTPPVIGKPAIEGFMKTFPRITEMSFQLEEIDGRGDLAFVRGAYGMTLDVPDAPDPVTDKGKFVEIRRKQPDGRWLVAVDIFNSDQPPPPPPPPVEPTGAP